jgi:hypothetical protein
VAGDGKLDEWGIMRNTRVIAASREEPEEECSVGLLKVRGIFDARRRWKQGDTYMGRPAVIALTLT